MVEIQKETHDESIRIEGAVRKPRVLGRSGPGLPKEAMSPPPGGTLWPASLDLR